MEGHVSVVAPSGKDAPLITSVLERASLPARACADVAEALATASGHGIGVLLIAEEALAQPTALRRLVDYLQAQASWSDLPVLLLTRQSKPVLGRAELDLLGNVTLIERPVQVATLTSAVRAALRNRNHQYAMREADRRKDEFLAMLAHELRNPLAPITNTAHILGTLGLHEPKLRLAVGVLQRQARQLSRLVDDLMDVARVSQGKIQLQRGLHDLRDLVGAGLETSMPQIEVMSHDINVRMPDAPVWVDADAARVSQCVTNLVSNAAKYTPRRGHIEVDLSVDESCARVTVRDDGIGFASAQAARLFERFAQVDVAQDRSQGGLGLGLAIVKSLIEMHGGTVGAHSEGHGTGALFEFTLPCAHNAARAPSAMPASPADADGSPSVAVLVVDDNQDSADSLASLLQALGHDVRKAYQGSEALAMLDTWQPTVAILDIGLPDMSGHDLAHALAQRLGPRTPVLVALSGWGQPGDQERSRSAGFAHHLTKPADVEQLLAILARLTATAAA